MMRGTDPRTDERSQANDVTPVGRRPAAGPSGLMIAIGAVFLGLLLFSVLEVRRRALTAPAVRVSSADLPVSSAPPPLYVPPEPAPEPLQSEASAAPTPLPPPTAPAPQPAVPYTPPVAIPYTPPYVPTPVVAPSPPRNSGGAALVLDTSQGRNGNSEGQSGLNSGLIGSQAATGRARAGTLENRATTVAQGTLIPAVLETAFDSSRAGFARALVQRDIRSFDGSRVLIQRGSRLIGEYRAESAPGQKRAIINWTRLIRPDGATIAISSPVADTLGRNGVRAQVDTHFLERFSGAILQSVLDIGVNLAARSTNSATVVALPGSFQGTANSLVQPTAIPPTLKLKPGTSVSVFVARDLDFTDVEPTP